ncbi:MAG TPA: hypothetical protein VEI97_05155, partial [bacterium]|nr:hypothetical protein [bacterium]
IVPSGEKGGRATQIFDNWVFETVRAAPQAARGATFDAMQDTFHRIHKTLVDNPNARLPVNSRETELVTNRLAELANDPEFWYQPRVKDGAKLIDPEVGVGPRQMFLTRFKEDYLDKLDNLTTQPFNDFFVQFARGGLNDPQGFVPALKTLYTKVQDTLGGPEGSKFMRELVGAFDDLMTATVSPEVGRLNRQTLWEYYSQAGLRAAESSRNLWQLEQMLAGSLKGPMTGLELANQVSLENKSIWKTLEMIAREGKTGTFNWGMVTPADLAKMSAELDRAAAQLVTAKKWSPAQATQFKAFVDNLKANPNALGVWLDVMKDASEITRREQMMQKIMAPILEPFQRMFSMADEATRKYGRSLMRNMADQLQAEQAMYDPTWLGRGLAPFLQRYEDTVVKPIMRFAGVPERLSQAMKENDNTMIAVDREAEQQGMAFIHRDLQTSVQEAAGRPFTGGPNDWKVPRNVLWDADQGFMRIYANREAANYGDIAHKDPKFATQSQTIRALGQKRTEEGWEMLARAFGETHTPGATTRPPRSQKFYDLMKTKIRSRSDDLFWKERAAGMVTHYRQDYIPHSLNGSFIDQDEFWTWLETKSVDNVLGTPGIAVEGPRRMIASTQFAPGKTRDFLSMVEVEYFLGEAAKDMARRGRKLKVEPNYSTAGAMAQRYLLHNRGTAARKFLSDLQNALPGHMLPLGWAQEGTATANGLNRAGFINLGTMMPGMRDWWVRQEMADFLKSKVSRFGTALDWEGHPLWSPFAILQEFQRKWKWLNTTLDIYHVKNIFALGLVGNVDVRRAGKILYDAFQARGSNIGSVGERMISPLEAWVEGLEKSPTFQLGLKNGLSPFRGHEYNVPLTDRIMAEMRPVTKPSEAANALKRDVWLKGGPGSKFTFDLLDQAVKMSKFEELVELGVPANTAAEITNYFLIDYSLRWMAPNARAWSYALFPFAAWKLGNWMLHPKNFIQNPSRYVLVDHIRRGLSNYFTGGMSDAYYKMVTDTVAGAVMLPLDMRDPQTGASTVADTAFPHDSIFQVIKRLGQEHPAEFGEEMLRYFTNNIWEVPYKWLVAADNQRRGETSQEAARHGWLEMIRNGLFGDANVFGLQLGRGSPDQEGAVSQFFWGLAPWKDAFQLMTDPRAWPNWDYYAAKLAGDMFMNMQNIRPSQVTGLPRRSPISR